MTVSVVNQTNTMKAVTLFHQQICVSHGKCLCLSGKPVTIYVPAGGRLKGVTDAIKLSQNLAGLNIHDEPKPVASPAAAEQAPEKKNTPKKKAKGKTGKGQGE